MNFNLKIALTKLKGAKVMEVEGKTCTKRCVVIPIDNDEGTVQDAYETTIDGLPSMKYLGEVYLNLTAFEYKDKKFGQSHGIKASFSKKRMADLADEELRTMPFVGNMKPWASKDDDLPPDSKDNGNDW
jgi:hypothetical protein